VLRIRNTFMQHLLDPYPTFSQTLQELHAELHAPGADTSVNLRSAWRQEPKEHAGSTQPPTVPVGNRFD